MSRGRTIALVAAACVVVGAIFVWKIFPRDEVSKATVGDAVTTFRESGGTKAKGDGPLFKRELGVYSYSTKGSETAKTAFLSATHDYNGVSTITLSSGRCGVIERWQVLASRWAEFESCPTEHGGFFELRGLSEFHEFFGRGRKSSYRCRGDSVSANSARRVGARFSNICESEDGVADSDSRVVKIEKIKIDGRAYDAVRTFSRVSLEGDVTGNATREDWRRRSDGLLLRRVNKSDAKMNETIDADYEEDYTIQLLSVDPRR